MQAAKPRSPWVHSAICGYVATAKACSIYKDGQIFGCCLGSKGAHKNPVSCSCDLSWVVLRRPAQERLSSGTSSVWLALVLAFQQVPGAETFPQQQRLDLGPLPPCTLSLLHLSSSDMVKTL